MTIICWDGKTLAGDRLGDANGLRRTATKIARIHTNLYGFAGYASRSAELIAWFQQGGLPKDVPAFQLTEDYQSILMVREDRRIFTYGRSGFPFEVFDKFHAVGSGRDFAIAAMHLGKTAREAVEIASLFDISCGNGVDTLEF